MKLSRMLICLVIIFLLINSVIEIVNSQMDFRTINFQDKNFEQAIRNEINKKVGEITLDDLMNITEIDFSDYDLRTIKEIEYFINLQELRIDVSLINDISPICKLYKLERISIGNFKDANLIDVDIEKIGNMINLKELSINQINLNNCDLSVFGNLKKLHTISLRNTGIDNISFISNLTSLEKLIITGSYSTWNNIEDINPIRQLVNLKELQLTFNGKPLKNCETIGNLTGLEVLIFNYNIINDFNFIRNLKELKVLNLDSVIGLSDINFLTGLKKLEKLNISGTGIRDISPIGNLIELKELNLANTDVINFDSLSGLKNLEVLDLGATGIEDISFLSELVKLRELKIASSMVLGRTK